MKNILVISLLFTFLLGCSITLQKQSSGNIIIANKNYNSVFSKTVQAAIISGLVVTKAEKENGFILATASHNPFLTNNAPAINIFLNKQGNGVNISIKSTIHGQIVDYGTSKNNIIKFCNTLQSSFPDSKCIIQ